MTTYAQGMFEALYGGFEMSFKTLPATPTADKLPVINPQFRPAVNRFRSEALSGSPEPRPIVDGKLGLDFSFELEASKESLTLPLKGLFGTVSTSGTTGFYDHYFTLGTMLPMFWEQRHTDISQNLLWQGAYIGEGQFNFEAEGLCKVTFSGMGAFQTNEGATTVITGTVSDKTGELPLDYMDGVVKVGGVTVGYVQTASVRVNRRLDKRNHIDQTNQVGVIFGQISEVGGQLKMSFVDNTYLDLAINSTETALEITVYNAGHGLRIYCPTIKLKPASPITNGTGLNDLEFDFDAYGRGSSSNIPGEAVSKYFTSEAGLSGLTLSLKVDGGASQVVTFGATDDTPTEVAAAINAQSTGCTASVDGGRVVIRSDATTGSTSSIEVEAASTADTNLGYDNAVHTGFDAKSIIVRVSNASATLQA